MSLLLLGISQVWLLVSLAVAQTWIQNLKNLFGALNLQYVLLWHFIDWNPFCIFYDRLGLEECVRHLTSVLLSTDNFKSPTTDS